MTNAQELTITSIGQIAVNVKDVERAITFYRDRLGLRFLFRSPSSAGDLAFFDCGGVRLMLGTAEQGEFDHPGSILYYNVADIESAHGELQGRGVGFRDDPHKVADLGTRELWLSFFNDSEGNVGAIMSERPKGG